jgi:hypothetical protein
MIFSSMRAEYYLATDSGSADNIPLGGIVHLFLLGNAAGEVVITKIVLIMPPFWVLSGKRCG